MSHSLQHARALRNAIAAGDVVSDDDIRGLAALIESILEKGRCAPSETETRVLVAGVQFVANASVSSNQRLQCWRLFYPSLILKISLSQIPDVLEPLCYALWNFAVDKSYSLCGEGLQVFNNLVNFYGDDANDCLGTSFSLFLGRVFGQNDVLLESPSLLKCIGKADIECFDKDVSSRLLRSLLEAAKQNDSREVLYALRNCVLALDVAEHLLVEIASWAVDKLYSLLNGQCPRIGYKTDLIALLCNLVWRRESIQAVVLDLNGLAPVLDSIRLDDDNPFSREWSLLFVRNMCIENSRAQNFIQSLELKEAMVDEHVGAHIEYDKLRGKFSVKRRPCKKDA